MQNQSPTWAFPVARFFVSFVYYTVLFFSLVFVLLFGAKLLGWQTENWTSASSHPNYVTFPVETSPAQLETTDAFQGTPFYYKPKKTEGELSVPISSTTGLIHSLMVLLSVGLGLYVFYLLRKIFKTARADSPFHADNARRISLIGVLFLVQTVMDSIYELVTWYQAKQYFARMKFEEPSFFSASFVFDGPWLLGFILLALAEVYRRGITLQEESELTV